jgi:DNA polymerase III epsilon subunit-like protein
MADSFDAKLFLSHFSNPADGFHFLGANSSFKVDQLMQQLKGSTPPPPTPPTPPPLPATPPVDVSDGESRPSTERPIEESPPVLAFDTETSGLNPPIVLQIAYSLLENNEQPKETSHILKLPAGVRIHPAAQAVHGISAERVVKEGVDPLPVFDAFLRLAADVVARGGRVVAHNSAFDVRAISTTIRYWNQPAPQFPLTFCTMNSSKAYSPLKNKRGWVKAFRNEELYEFLFSTPPTERLHDAMGDVRVTLKNYMEAQQRGWW